MDDSVKRIKEKIDIVEYIGRTVQLKKAGKNFVGLCPFHSEHSPSFNVSPDRGIFKCFGCGVSGDVFTYLIQHDGLDFPEALKILADEAGVVLDRARKREDSEARRLEDLLFEIHQVAAEYYHYLLLTHDVGEEAREYLKGRDLNVDDPQGVVATFKLGYAPKSWDSLGTYLLNKGYSKENILLSGLSVKAENPRGFYDMFRGRVMYPLYDKAGRVVGFSGRILGVDKTAKYINSPETLIFHKREFLFGFFQAKDSIRRMNEVILVEGEMDMLSSYQAGVKNIVAVKGSVLTPEQIDMLSKVSKKLLLCFDSDFAGDKAMRSAIELADSKELEVRVIQLKYGKDPDECVRHDVKLWEASVAGAIPFYDYILTSSISRHSSTDPYGKQKVVEEVLPYISAIKNMVVRSHYYQKMSTLLDIPEPKLRAWGTSTQSVVQSSSKAITSSATPKLPKNQSLWYLFALLLRLDRPVVGIEKKLQDDDIDDKAILLVYNWYVDFFSNYPSKSVRDLLQTATEELSPVIDELSLVDIPYDSEDELRAELFLTLKKYKENSLRFQIKATSHEMRQLEIQPHTVDQVQTLQKKMESLLERLSKLQSL